MADKYIQNVHTNGIKVPITLGGKPVVKRFPIIGFDVNGRAVETGYTRVTDEEYAACQKEKIFRYFVDKKKLVVHDSLPAEAMTPHDALVSARKESGKMGMRIQDLEKDNARLQKELEAAKVKYAELAGASKK